MARKTIEQETQIYPDIAAERIVEEVTRAMIEGSGKGPAKALAALDHDGGRSLIAYLAKRAEDTYAANNDFRNRIKSGSRGRETLYAFMRHWAAARVKEVHGNEAFQALPRGFAQGKEPPAPVIENTLRMC